MNWANAKKRAIESFALFFVIVALVSTTIVVIDWDNCVAFYKKATNANQRANVGTCITAVMSFFAVIAAAIACWWTRKQSKNDHERSRKKESLQLMQDWWASRATQGVEVMLARRLLLSLTHPKIRRLYSVAKNESSFSITIDDDNIEILIKLREMINTSHAREDIPCQNSTKTTGDDKKCNGTHGCSGKKSNQLNEVEVLFLRSCASAMLNELEIISAAYCSGIADKEMIKKEFLHLYVGDNTNARFLSSCMESVDKSTFKSTRALCAEFSSIINKEPKPETNVG